MGMQEGKGATGPFAPLMGTQELSGVVEQGSARHMHYPAPGALLVPPWAGGREQSQRAAAGCQMSVLASGQQEGLHRNQQELSGLRTTAGGYF